MLNFRYATHVSVCHTKFAIKLPENIPLDVACMLPCSGLTTFAALKKLQPTVERKTKQKGISYCPIINF